MAVKILIILSLLIVGLVIFTLIPPPKTAGAFQLYSFFGGRVKKWDGNPAGCIALTESLKAAIMAATAGTVQVDIDIGILEVGAPLGGEFGVFESIKIDQVPIPILTPTVYQRGNYKETGKWVLGTYLNLCDGPVKGIPYVDKIIGAVCGTTNKLCPIQKLITKIGSS